MEADPVEEGIETPFPPDSSNTDLNQNLIKEETGGGGGEPSVSSGSTAAIATNEPAPMSGESSVDGSIHPLLNENILDNVFKFIMEQSDPQEVVDDVQVLRQVSKTWNDAITRVYRRTRAPTTFGFDQGGAKPYVNDYELRKVKRFLKAMKKSAMIPVQNYNFIGDFFSNWESCDVFQQFLQICGPEMVSLSFDLNLYHCDPYGACFYLCDNRDINLKKLKKLTFTVSMDDPAKTPSQTAALGEFLGRLLNAAEELKEFEFDFDPVTPSENPKEVAVAVKLMKPFQDGMSRNIPKSVKILRLKTLLSGVTLSNLMENDVKPEELEIFINSKVEGETIQKFLEDQAGTLKTLRIAPSFNWTTPSWGFPRMGELRELELRENLNLQPFSVFETFPNLHCLNGKEWRDEDTFLELLAFGKKKTVPTLKIIHLPYASPICGLIKNVADAFPKIKELHIFPCDETEETIHKVFTYFPRIEHLDITIPLKMKLNLDAVFSGVSNEHCQRIKPFFNFDRVSLGRVQRKSSLLNLTKLKKLTLNSPEGDSYSRATLSNFCAHFVFLKMPELKQVSLPQCQSRLSHSYIERLKKNLKLTIEDDGFYVDSSDSENDDDDGEEDNLSDDEDELVVHPVVCQPV